MININSESKTFNPEIEPYLWIQTLSLFSQTKDSEKTGCDQTKILSLSLWQEKHEQSREYAYCYYKVSARVKANCTWEGINTGTDFFKNYFILCSVRSILDMLEFYLAWVQVFLFFKAKKLENIYTQANSHYLLKTLSASSTALPV